MGFPFQLAVDYQAEEFDFRCRGKGEIRGFNRWKRTRLRGIEIDIGGFSLVKAKFISSKPALYVRHHLCRFR